ncbi:YwqG family protein [Pseudomonas chlororaphis]|uniref:hypothetical protein n=1 Tax=Pseudomonas chlororaphis TaxID=587753 RepID=UPI0003D2D908|nr:hypothetical protein [Pseudomonas chlororaphis]AZD27013.1 hypothetical protein C4K23_0232 [Pseudomonas chlororaphis]ETD35617.1 hypothetical protein U724_26765 [Pseudomonas chlororaphis subsp. aurantiaca PB-St2]QFS58263.1 hypothetical protein FD951_28165 [Pseudomonas chlororaphis subsp. aurantiaca]
MYINKIPEAESASYIGGKPAIPQGISIPKSPNGSLMSFYFTLQFPEVHSLHGYTLSVFAATDDFNEDYTIPEMLKVPLLGATIPDHFLRNYQKYFAAFLFRNEEKVYASDYPIRIAMTPLAFSHSKGSDVFGWAGDKPKWLMDDETPDQYSGAALDFLLQVHGEQSFPIIDTAPAQQELDIFGGSKSRAKRNYTLFNQNEIYFFGSRTEDFDDRVYIVTQCD